MMMMNKKIISIFAIVMALFLVQIAYAVPFTVTGTITGQGVPIEGATVSVLRIPGPVLEASTTTAADGTYSLVINNAAPKYQINVDPIGIYAGDHWGPDSITADIIKNFDLVPIASVTVSGTVIDNSGNPLDNVAVSFLIGTSLVKTVNTVAGDYSTIIGDGQNYNIEASLAGYETEKTSITTVSSDIDLDFTLSPPCPDADGDGYDDLACGGTDCDDNILTGNTIYPGATEICDDTIDQDCNGFDLACPVAAPSGGGGGGGGGGGNHEYVNMVVTPTPIVKLTPVVTPTPVAPTPIVEETPAANPTPAPAAPTTGAAIVNLVQANPITAGIIGLFVLGLIGYAIYYFRRP